MQECYNISCFLIFLTFKSKYKCELGRKFFRMFLKCVVLNLTFVIVFNKCGKTIKLQRLVLRFYNEKTGKIWFKIRKKVKNIGSACLGNSLVITLFSIYNFRILLKLNFLIKLKTLINFF